MVQFEKKYGYKTLIIIMCANFVESNIAINSPRIKSLKDNWYQIRFWHFLMILEKNYTKFFEHTKREYHINSTDPPLTFNILNDKKSVDWMWWEKDTEIFLIFWEGTKFTNQKNCGILSSNDFNTARCARGVRVWCGITCGQIFTRTSNPNFFNSLWYGK